VAVDANTYGTVAQVEIWASEIAASRTFTTSTQPTLSQVEQILDLVADELNMHMVSAGYTVPVTVSLDPATFRYLRASNSYGAAAEVLATYPNIAFGGPDNIDAMPTERRRHFENQFRRCLKMIDDKTLAQAVRAEGPLNDFQVGAQYDDDNKVKKPTFTRKMWDAPGTPVRIEE
jgi:hypothetical protein